MVMLRSFINLCNISNADVRSREENCIVTCLLSSLAMSYHFFSLELLTSLKIDDTISFTNKENIKLDDRKPIVAYFSGYIVSTFL